MFENIIVNGKNKYEMNKALIILFGVGMVVCCAILLYMNRNEEFFYSDEGDNMFGGYLISKGILPYTDVFDTQHMPVMYYLCSLFALLGARTIIGFRYCFYAFLCLFWLAMYSRYNKYFGTLVCAIFPVLYVLAMRTNEFCYAILSEQLWAQGAVILFMEYLIYRKERKISISSSIWISIAVFISFGTCFVSAYSIAIIVVAVLFTEIATQVSNKEPVLNAIKNIWKNLWKMLLIVIAPFAVMIGSLAITGRLKAAIFDSFTINTDYYSKYLSTTESFLSPMIGALKGAKHWLATINSDSHLLLFAIILCAFLSVLIILKKYQECVVCFCFFILCGVRGFFNFHSIGQLSILMLLLAFLINWFVYVIVSRNNNIVNLLICIVLIMVLISPLWVPYAKDRNELINPSKFQHAKIDYYVDVLTDEGDYVWDNTLDMPLVLHSETMPAAGSFICPWGLEALDDKIWKQLNERKPIVLTYKENLTVWGYDPHDFAKRYIDYINSNYVNMDDVCDGLWVRKDYYKEACKRLKTPEKYLSRKY